MLFSASDGPMALCPTPLMPPSATPRELSLSLALSKYRGTAVSGLIHADTNSSCNIKHFFRFIARTTEVDYVDIVPGKGGCYTVIPYRFMLYNFDSCI